MQTCWSGQLNQRHSKSGHFGSTVASAHVEHTVSIIVGCWRTIVTRGGKFRWPPMDQLCKSTEIYTTVYSSRQDVCIQPDDMKDTTTAASHPELGLLGSTFFVVRVGGI